MLCYSLMRQSITAQSPLYITQTKWLIKSMQNKCHSINQIMILYNRMLYLICQVLCKAVVTFFQYCVLSNFYWLLVEGLYLQTLLVFTFARKRTFFWWYTLIGWGKNTFYITGSIFYTKTADYSRTYSEVFID